MITKTVTLKPIAQKVVFVLARNQQAILMPVGDVHFGTLDFPTEKFVTHFRWGMDRGAWFLGMGEYLDSASYSQRAIYNQLRDSEKIKEDDKIRKQADELLGLIGFTKGRWIGLIEGDHRWDFVTGRSVDQYIARGLGCDFLGTSTLLRLKLDHIVPRGHDEADCIVYAHHGVGSSQTAGGQLNKPESLLKWIAADIYLMGHTHAKLADPIDQQCITPDGVLYHRTKIIARTGGWLAAYTATEPLDLDAPVTESRGTYVEQRALMPSAMGGLCFGIGVEQIEGSKYFRPALHFSV